MMSALPIALALSATWTISHGERNWPFLMFTGFPQRATAWMKLVWRHRNAGVWSTSTTDATSSIGVSSCTSVITATPTSLRTRSRIRSPFSRPGPRKLSCEVRLALSNEDL